MFTGLEASGADVEAFAGRKSRPLEIGFSEAFSYGVKFCSTNTVGVSSAHSGTFVTEWT